jgi:hypothetical protein
VLVRRRWPSVRPAARALHGGKPRDAVTASHVGGKSVVAFLGPSLPAPAALRLAPEVELWPSVWHKEIRHALHLGVRVIGASDDVI